LLSLQLMQSRHHLLHVAVPLLNHINRNKQLHQQHTTCSLLL
jgi:hypothetical protein